MLTIAITIAMHEDHARHDPPHVAPLRPRRPTVRCNLLLQRRRNHADHRVNQLAILCVHTGVHTP